MQWYTKVWYIVDKMQSYSMNSSNKKTVFTFAPSIFTFLKFCEKGRPHVVGTCHQNTTIILCFGFKLCCVFLSTPVSCVKMLSQNHFAESNWHVLTFLHRKFDVECKGGVALHMKLKSYCLTWESVSRMNSFWLCTFFEQHCGRCEHIHDLGEKEIGEELIIVLISSNWSGLRRALREELCGSWVMSRCCSLSCWKPWRLKTRQPLWGKLRPG